MTWMGLRDAKPQKGGEARIPFLGLVTVVTVSYFIEPMGRKNAKRMQLGGMQVIVLLATSSDLIYRVTSVWITRRANYFLVHPTNSVLVYVESTTN
jgi:hypothetical protein